MNATASIIDRIDFDAMARKSKSHTADEYRQAVESGDTIWSFDSGCSWHDDLLIYREEDEETIMAELEGFFETGEFADPPRQSAFDRGQPNAWTLERLTLDDLVERFPIDD